MQANIYHIYHDVSLLLFISYSFANIPLSYYNYKEINSIKLQNTDYSENVFNRAYRTIKEYDDIFVLNQLLYLFKDLKTRLNTKYINN